MAGRNTYYPEEIEKKRGRRGRKREMQED